MAFALQGTNEISQSGTDNDFSALETNLSHLITIYTLGNLKIFDMGNYRLISSGVIQHDPDKELLIFRSTAASPDITLNGGARYRYGNETTANSNTRYSSGCGLIFSGEVTSDPSGAPWNASSYGSIYLSDSNARFIGRGGVIQTTKPIGIYSGARFDVINTVFTKASNITARREIRYNDNTATPTGDFKGILDGMIITHRKLPTTLSPIIINGGIHQLAQTTDTSFTITDLDVSNNIDTQLDLGTDDLQGNSGNTAKFYDIINCSIGSAVRCMPKPGVGNTRQLGGAIVKKRIKVKLTVEDGSGLLDGKIFIRDTDNGDRKNANSQDHTADKTYTLTTDNNGDTTATDITTAITNIDSESTAVDYTDWDTDSFSKRYKVDRRGNSDTSGEDIFTLKIIAYGYELAQTNQALKGLGTLEIPWTMFADDQVTETGKTLVDAYTELETAAKVHDAALAYLFDNYNGETAKYCTQIDGKLDFDDADVKVAQPYDTTVSYVAGDACYQSSTIYRCTASTTGTFDASDWTALTGTPFTVDSDDIYFYIGAGTLTADMETSGTFTIKDYSKIAGSVVDSTANSNLVFESIDSWKVYLTEANWSANTGEVASGSGSETYRFNFSSGTIYYLRLTIQGEDVLKRITPTAIGDTEVTLSTSALLSSVVTITNKLDALIGTDSSNNYRFTAKALELGAGFNADDRARLADIEQNSQGLTPVIELTDMPSYTLNSAISTRTISNGNLVLTRNSGSVNDFIILFRTINPALTIGEASGDLDLYILKLRNANTGANPASQTIRITVTMFESTNQIIQSAEETITLDSHRYSRFLAFPLEHQDNTRSIDQIQLSIKGVNTVLSLESEGFYKKGLIRTSSPSVAQISDGVWDETLADHTTTGTTGKKLDDLTSGGGGGSAPSSSDIATAVWNQALSGHTGSGSAGKKLSDIPSTSPTIPTASDIADAVLDEALSGHTGSGTLGKAVSDIPSAADNADAVLDEILSGHTTTGSLGKAISDLSSNQNIPLAYKFFASDGTTEVFDRADAYQAHFFRSGQSMAAVKFGKQTSASDTTRVKLDDDGQLIVVT